MTYSVISPGNVGVEQGETNQQEANQQEGQPSDVCTARRVDTSLEIAGPRSGMKVESKK